MVTHTKKNILLVDDAPLIRRLFGGKLSSLGFEVLYASNGNEGREISRRLLPDLILLDIHMPGMDGIELAKKLRADKRTENIPVVFFTNEDLSPEEEKAVKESLVADYIHKGVDMEEFTKRITGLLDKYG